MRRILAMSVLVILLAPWAFAGIKTDYDHSANFQHYRTFAWKATPPNPPNGIVNNSLVCARIRRAVDQELMTKGMREDKQNPDVYLTYHIGAKNRKSVGYFPGYGWGWPLWRWGWGGGWWGGGDVVVDRYLQGNLVIDMADAHTNQLVWRAYGTDTGTYLSDLKARRTSIN